MSCSVKNWLGTILALFVVSLVGGFSPAYGQGFYSKWVMHSHAGKYAGMTRDQLEAEVVKEINLGRQQAGVVALTADARLTPIARGYSEFAMGAKGLAEQIMAGPGVRGKDIDVKRHWGMPERVQAVRAIFGANAHFAEVSMFTGTPESTVNGWMKPGIYRDHLLNSKATIVGVGLGVREGDEELFYTVILSDGVAPLPPTATVDPTGNWETPDRSFKFAVKPATVGKGIVLDFGTQTFFLEARPEPNTYKINGSDFSVIFTSKDTGMYKHTGAGFFIQRAGSTPGPVPPQPNPSPRPAPPTPPSPQPAPQVVVIPIGAVPGRYVRDNPENGYHDGTIELVEMPGGRPSFRWKNKQGLSWSLTDDLANNQLVTGPDNPYFVSSPTDGRAFRLVHRKNADGSRLPEIEGFFFNGEFYRRTR